MGKEINKIVSGMIQFYRDVLLYKNIDTTDFSRYILKKKNLKTCRDGRGRKIFYYVDALSDIQSRIRTTAAPHIYLEVALVKMINGYADGDVEHKIAALEQRLRSVNEEASVGLQEKVNNLEKELFGSSRS